MQLHHSGTFYKGVTKALKGPHYPNQPYEVGSVHRADLDTSTKDCAPGIHVCWTIADALRWGVRVVEVQLGTRGHVVVNGKVRVGPSVTVTKVDVQRDADLVGADLRDADLGGANLRGANLGGADLRDANLLGANLRDANLRDADLVGANLRDANLRDADLGGANLRDANLLGANLVGANLRDANLLGANLVGADLRDADLGGAYLGGAYLRGARGLPVSGMPDGWKIEGGLLVRA